MTRAVAINVGANTNEPGFRGPIFPDGRVEFVPIPESEPTDSPVATYDDLDLAVDVSSVADTPVHLDPEFAEVGGCDRYTYGDPYPVKARPLLDLAAGDHVFFYATLDAFGEPERPWISPGWGAYVIGRFELARDPVPGESYADLSEPERAPFAGNAHVKREVFDAAVLLLGDEASSCRYERGIPLSADEGSVPNAIVTDLSEDSGRGPWWRRPLRFDAAATRELLSLERAGDDELAALATE